MRTRARARRLDEITRSLVTLASVTDRLVPFTGVLNFRDLGGYETDDGRHTRWGRLFRSDAMHDLTEEDLEMFRGLGIASVVDLRSVKRWSARAADSWPTSPFTL